MLENCSLAHEKWAVLEHSSLAHDLTSCAWAFNELKSQNMPALELHVMLAMWKSFDPVIVQCCSITFIISFLTIQCHRYSDYGHNHRDQGPDHQDNDGDQIVNSHTWIDHHYHDDKVILLLLTYDTIMLLHLKCHYIFVSLWRLSF